MLKKSSDLHSSEMLRSADSISSDNWGRDFGARWIGAIHDGFRNAYPDKERFAVFSRARDASIWGCQEYLYDVAVAETERRRAPYANTFVPVITQCLWQVESEVEKDASAVAKDLGKLVLGFATSKLLIVASPSETRDQAPWIDFIEQAAKHVPNNFFLALIPTYSTSASAHQAWIVGTAGIKFFRRIDGSLIPDELQISAEIDEFKLDNFP